MLDASTANRSRALGSFLLLALLATQLPAAAENPPTALKLKPRVQPRAVAPQAVPKPPPAPPPLPEQTLQQFVAGNLEVRPQGQVVLNLPSKIVLGAGQVRSGDSHLYLSRGQLFGDAAASVDKPAFGLHPWDDQSWLSFTLRGLTPGKTYLVDCFAKTVAGKAVYAISPTHVEIPLSNGHLLFMFNAEGGYDDHVFIYPVGDGTLFLYECQFVPLDY